MEDYESSPGEPKPVWLEPLANGLTFDLMGLAPGPPAELPPRVHCYALAADAADMRWEAVTIRPGPDLTGGHAMLPVVRSLAWLAATLCESEGVEAVVWHPARTWSGADYFRDGVLRWIVWRG